jgi:hypothetical protein
MGIRCAAARGAGGRCRGRRETPQGAWGRARQSRETVCRREPRTPSGAAHDLDSTAVEPVTAKAEQEAGRKRLNLDGPAWLWQRRRRARVPPPRAPDLAPARPGPSCSPPDTARTVTTSACAPSQPLPRGELQPPPPRRASVAASRLHSPRRARAARASTVTRKERIGAVGMGKRREVPRTGGLEGSKLSLHLQTGKRRRRYGTFLSLILRLRDAMGNSLESVSKAMAQHNWTTSPRPKQATLNKNIKRMHSL